MAGPAVQVHAAGGGLDEEAVRPSAHGSLGSSIWLTPRPRYPEELADRSWDNVGLLVGSAEAQGKKPKVLVTNDLTYQVAVDAIKQDVGVIVSYRAYPTPLAAAVDVSSH